MIHTRGRNIHFKLYAAIHAREHISLASVSYMINEIINNPEDNLLLDDLDFYFLPGN